MASTAVIGETAPHPIGRDSRVLHVAFNSTDVIRLHTDLRVNTAIELGPGERINQVLLGDSESYEVQVLSNRNTVSVKPVVSGARTNMTIYTNRRAIAFFLTEGSRATATFRVVIEFRDERRVSPERPAGGRDVGYQFSNDSTIKPIRVWNDGTSTFFEFADNVRPSVFGVNSSGFEISQNSQTQGNIVRVNSVRTDYTIRIGEDYVCIRRVEEGFTTNEPIIAVLRAREF